MCFIFLQFCAKIKVLMESSGKRGRNLLTKIKLILKSGGGYKKQKQILKILIFLI